jgi:hypothetical protein
MKWACFFTILFLVAASGAALSHPQPYDRDRAGCDDGCPPPPPDGGVQVQSPALDLPCCCPMYPDNGCTFEASRLGSGPTVRRAEMPRWMMELLLDGRLLPCVIVCGG